MPQLTAIRSAMKGAVLSGAFLGWSAGAGTTLLAATPTFAQPAVEATNAQLLEDFIFYVNIANIELAAANAQAILDRRIAPRDFLAIVEDAATLEERFDKAVIRAQMRPELEPLAAELFRLYRDGRLARARQPDEIARNIALLAGAPRGQILARERLRHAGEYAVPQLLDVLIDRRNPVLESEVTRVLISMGRQAVAPLSVAILGVDETTQEQIARILGEIRYQHALPYLTEVARSTANPRVKAAAERAIEAVGGRLDRAVSLAGLYRELAERYYAEPRDLTAFHGETFQLLWSYDPGLGLQPTAIRTEVFHEAVSMGLTERSLRIDPTDELAIALWVASNFSRELDQPEDYDNPAYPDGFRREAMYFAVASGAGTMQQVLARALRDRDTRLARLAIEALARSAGGPGLVASQERALARALTYPDRRVRYEAAIAIGRAAPRDSFEGAESVVPILASIIRDAGTRYAGVLASNLERQQVVRASLETQGYTVLPPGFTLADIQSSIAEVAGVDLLVMDLATETTVEAIEQARRMSRLQATPIFALLSGTGYAQIASRFDTDRMTMLGRQGITDDQFQTAVDDLVTQASGAPMTADEAEQYAFDALDVLFNLALSSAGQRQVLDVTDASVPLVGAMETAQGEIRMRIAEVLSHIGQQRVQVALMDAAMNARGDDRIALLEKMISSAKRFGNLLEDRQVRWLVQQADSPDEAEATTAAALMGALNLPNDRLVPLILGGA